MAHPEIRLSPYAKAIGVSLEGWDGAAPILAADYSDQLCGNPGMFHGGAIGGLLEMAAVAALEAELAGKDAASVLSPVNSTIEYLRAAGDARTYASARIVRAGRRLANVQATLWQESPDKPVAISFVNIMIAPAAA